MAKNLKVIPYVSECDFLTKGAPHATKFADFITKVAQAKAIGCDCVIIPEPWVIGTHAMKLSNAFHTWPEPIFV